MYTLRDIEHFKIEAPWWHQQQLSVNSLPYTNTPLDCVRIARLFERAGQLHTDDVKLLQHPRFEPIYIASERELLRMAGTTHASLPRSELTRRVLAASLAAHNEVHFTGNDELVNILNTIADGYKKARDKFRSDPFRKAAQYIAQLKEPVVSGDQIKAAVKGVGASTVEVINQYLRGQPITRLQQFIQASTTETVVVAAPVPQSPQRTIDLPVVPVSRKSVVELLCTVHGIGEANANKFFEQGYYTIDSLRSHPKLTTAQRLGLKHYVDMQERIPRDEISTLHQFLQHLLGTIRFEIAGSYRRGEATSGDIDLLVELTDTVTLDTVVALLRGVGVIVDELSCKDRKFLGFAVVPGYTKVRRMDVRMFTAQEWYYGLLYNTGSMELNVAMRQVAIDYGFTLSEYGLTRDGPVDNSSAPLLARALDKGLYDQVNGVHSIRGPSEEAIFEVMGLRYLSPDLRKRDITRAALMIV